MKFKKEDYEIVELSYDEAMDLVVKNHYLHRKSPCSKAFGLNHKTKGILGCIVYGTPASSTLRMGVCGKDEKDNVIELTRLWIHDCVGKNAESFLISNTVKSCGKDIVVSYADTSAEHVGYVYQASNWIYVGLSAKRTNWVVEGLDKHNCTLVDKYSAKDIREKYGDRFKLVPRSRKHRYVWFNGSKKRRKELRAKLKYKVLDYPKGTNA